MNNFEEYLRQGEPNKAEKAKVTQIKGWRILACLNPLRGLGLYIAIYHGFTPMVIHIVSFQDFLYKTTKVV